MTESQRITTSTDVLNDLHDEIERLKFELAAVTGLVSKQEDKDREIERLEAELSALKEDLHDERNRGLALLEDAKHWKSELVKCEADKFHLAAELAALKSQQPVGYVHPNYASDYIGGIIRSDGFYDQRQVPVYAAAGAMITHHRCMCGKDVK